MLVIDWGTTNLRAYSCRDDGFIVARTELEQGIKVVAAGQYPTVLCQVSQELDLLPDETIYVCGMAGARGGWMEAAYCETPVAIKALKAGLLPLPEPFKGFLVPGIKTLSAGGILDVIRGEEIQVFGALRQLGLKDALICLPGTHSKWVQVRNRQIVSFMTFMTGDVFQALGQTILNCRAEDGFDEQAFLSGLTESQQTGGGLLHQLFTARTRMLAAELKNEQVSSFVSGLLIGHELKESEVCRRNDEKIVIIGSELLTQRYRIALEQASAAVETLGSDIATCSGIAALRQFS
ncbi:MAG: 2-dehydro-3-deoxygalactonokinase [Desulfuromonadales bacterium]|nr:2-dehydro-3-deoxygalactonokinase [Desulfuromonadales bacterium]